MENDTKLWLVNQLLEFLHSKESKNLPLTSIQRFILISLFYFCNPQTLECWPSYSRMANALGVKPNAIKVNIKKLEKMGILTIEKRKLAKGGFDNNKYHISVDNLWGLVSLKYQGWYSRNTRGGILKIPELSIELNNITNKQQEDVVVFLPTQEIKAIQDSELGETPEVDNWIMDMFGSGKIIENTEEQEIETNEFNPRTKVQP